MRDTPKTDNEEPQRPVAVTDTMPLAMAPQPRRVIAQTARFEPSRPKLRSDNDDPNCPKWNTDNEAPIRAKERNDNDDAS